jgi:tetratricopeptide (TPR) repeat protein
MPIPISRLALALCALVLALSARAASPGEEAFHRGFKAFRAGDYAAALGSFQEARRAGVDSAQLRHNLGVTYYRLGRYAEAEREFRALTQVPSWAAVAYYNLGLTAQRAGRAQEAADYFRLAHRESAEPGLRLLAATALERMGLPRPLVRTSFFASLGAGHDSNATLSPDLEAEGLSGESDTFVEALASVSHRLGGSEAAGLYALGSVYARRYADVSRFDLTGLRGGLARETRSAARSSSIGGYIEQVYIDDETLQRAATLDLYARWPRGRGGDLRTRYRVSRVEGGTGYGYIDGWQHRLSADAGFGWGRAAARAGYELELNERDDLVQGSEFFSFSPTRHLVYLRAVRPAAGAWRVEARGEIRLSRYDDPNRLADGSLLRREDDRLGVALRASRPLEGRWRLYVAYEYYDNRSNLATYDYSRGQLSAGVEYALEK